MHFVVFGLSVSSSWGNGHATIWRSLIKGLAKRGHTVSFYERDVPYYASTRDQWIPPAGCRLNLYDCIASVQTDAAGDLDHADLALSTSYCPDGPAAARLILNSAARLKGFYDLDTPVTLNSLHEGNRAPYLPDGGLEAFDLVLSYTGGRALEELRSELGARIALPLYGSVDPETHFRVPPLEAFCADLSYLGTYAADRQEILEELFILPATRLPARRFLLGGAQYPEDFPWRPNIHFVPHLPPSSHPAFFSSARGTLNVTRRSMAQYGYCPSGRLFEAAACGAAILSDWWEGLDSFFVPQSEILRVRSAADIEDALSLSDQELCRIGEAAREHVLARHTAAHRALHLEQICECLISSPEHRAIAQLL
jgi:spore maturation protein CgeB